MFKNNKKFIFLFTILLISFFLRTHRLTDFLTWTVDASRDVLIAKHYIYYGDKIIARPLAAGGMGLIINSPVYYFIVTLFFLLFESPLSVVFSFSLMGFLSVIATYLLAKKLGKEEEALVLTACVAFGFLFVSTSRQIWQPFLLPSLTIFSLLFFFKSFEKKGIIYPAISITIGFLMAHIHLSSFPYLMSLSLLLFYYIFKKRNKGFNLLNFSLYFLNNLLIWMLATLPQHRFLSQHFLLIGGSSNISPTTILNNLRQNIYFINENLFQLSGSLGGEGLSFLGLFLLIVGLLIVYYKKHNIKNKEENNYFITLTILSIISISLYMRIGEGYYLHSYATIFLIFLWLAISKIKVKSFKWMAYLILLYFISRNTFSFLFANPKYEYQADLKISEIILEDKEINGNYNFEIFFSDTGQCFDAVSHSYWFFLEEKLDEKLITIKEDGDNLTTKTDVETGYLVCDKEAYSDEECLRKFAPPYEIKKNLYLGETNSGGVNRSVYKLYFDTLELDNCQNRSNTL